MNNTSTGRHCCHGVCVQAFTLAELLVVIAVMGIVIAISIPAFQGIGRGAGMRAATVQVKTTLGLARQWAITHRQRTYVVFPTWYSGMSSNSYKACRAYGVFAVTDLATGSGYYAKDWTFLPPGVVFNTDGTLSATVFANSCLTNVPFPSAGSPQRLMNVVAFKPDGAGGRVGDYRVYLAEGGVVVDTSTWTVAYDVQPTGVVRSVHVYGLTGGLRVRE